MSMFAKKSFVGVDLGHHTMKVAQVERTHSGWRVAKYASAPTPVDTIRDGIVIDPPVLGLALKHLMKEAHIGATTASIAVSGGTVVVRPVRMPKMAPSALRKSIRFEASRYVPNSIEDSYIEFEIVNDSDEVNMDVLISAAPKELIDSRMRACEAAGLEIENVEIGAFAAFRALIEADPSQDWSDKTVALLDIGASTSNLSIVSHGSFSMTRAIPNGGQVLTDTLKNYFKLSSEDAERGKAQLDVRELISDAKVIENPPLRVLHSHLDDMVREVRRSINYWQSQQTEGVGPKQLDQIVMSGGGSQMPGLSEYFEHKLGIPTRAIGVFDNARFVGAHSHDEHGFQLALASGLAMAMAPTKVAVAHKPAKPAAIEKPAKAAKPPRAPKPPKGPKGKTEVEEEAPAEQLAPPQAIPTHEPDIQIPAAFQSSAPAASATPFEPEIDMQPIAPPLAPTMIATPEAEAPPFVPMMETHADEPTATPFAPTMIAAPEAEAPPFVPMMETQAVEPPATPFEIQAPTFEAPKFESEIEAQAFKAPLDIAAPAVEAPTLAVEHIDDAPSLNPQMFETAHAGIEAPTFEESMREQGADVPSELRTALDAMLDQEKAAQDALVAPMTPTPEPEPIPEMVADAPPMQVEAVAPAATVAEKPKTPAKPVKKSMFSAFSLAKKPKVAKAAKPGKPAKAEKLKKVKVVKPKAEKPQKAKAQPPTGLKTAKPAKTSLFSFSFKKKPKAAPAKAVKAETDATTVAPKAPAAKPKLGGSLFKKRTPDDVNEAPKKEAA